jgi:hypothetical protein
MKIILGIEILIFFIGYLGAMLFGVGDINNVTTFGVVIIITYIGFKIFNNNDKAI